MCSKCWAKYSFITDPLCKICGRPFEIVVEQESICLGCTKLKPSYKISRSIFKFEENSKSLVHNFKYHDKTYLSKFFANLLHNKYQKIISKADMITCVPMHKFKRIFRLYNHAFILAKDLAKISNKAFEPDIITKTRSTKSQTYLSKTARKENIKGSFALNNLQKVKGKRVLLIDDVITTGETINTCSRELKKAGAKEVVVLSIAKTYF